MNELPEFLSKTKLSNKEINEIKPLMYGWHTINAFFCQVKEISSEKIEKMMVYELTTKKRPTILNRLAMKLNSCRRQEIAEELAPYLKY